VIGFSLKQTGESNLRLMEQYNRMLLTAALIDDSTSGRVYSLPGGLVWPTYSLDDLQRRRIRRAAALLAEIHFNAGAQRVLLPFLRLPEIRSMDEVKKIAAVPLGPNEIELNTVHLMGTCAMGADPRRHVVRPSGETWDIEGLFVGDASVLPTSTGINPQVTIQALALRIADSVLDQLRK
jgi:choline dehydrogenase-like flavoprotein